jgi:peptidoglycan/xylan/chitin deacetylase (PgdA/CDA1 family)
MSLKPCGVSFDDGLVDQLKWARYMARLGLQGMFYVCPGLLGKHWQKGQVVMGEGHLEEIAGLGHLVGNHTWRHECPANTPHLELMASWEKARKWLEKRGYDGLSLALPYGSRGGKWEGSETLLAIRAMGIVPADVRFSGERSAPSGLPGRLESTEGWEGPSDLRYFHGNHATTDMSFVAFMDKIAKAQGAGGTPSPTAPGLDE